MLISKEKFIKIMNEFKKLVDSSHMLSDALANYDNCTDFGGFSNMRAESIIVDLLNILVQDFPDDYVGSTIDFFIYDLNWGKDWTEDSICEADGTPIRLSTFEELYDYLEQHYSVQGESNGSGC